MVGKRMWALAILCGSLSAVGCDDGDDEGSDAGTAGDAGEMMETDAGPVPTIPLDPDSPWPKFRANPEQTGRADVDPVDDGTSMPWVFPTGKGIFSTPVIDGAGNIYVGSADRSFYALSPDGSERWSLLTDEIIDSSALLDDMGRVYFGSGDGRLYARDRETGDEVWTFEADDPSINDAFINWFEGNVAIGTDGNLYVPNDNFCTYAIDRATGEQVWCFTTADQTWSLPAVNAATGQLFIGNNFLLGDNMFALSASNGRARWRAQAGGTVAASPMLTGLGSDDLVVMGSFDGFVRALAQGTGEEVWTFGARDHVYASPSQLSDGTIIQPAADGTIYALDPADGTVVWSFDTLEPIRSSAAVDAEDQIYVGSGEGRLFVLNPDGTLRFAMRATGDWARGGTGETVTMDDQRSDLNASVALGPTGAVVAGENGGIYFVPYDYCLRDSAMDDARCTLGPDEDLPDDGAFLYFTDRFGGPLAEPPASIEANEPLTFSLFVREGADTQLARIDSDSVTVTITPDVAATTTVSGDRTFLSLVPTAPWADAAGGTVEVRVQGDYLTNLDRDGLRFTGGEVGGSFDETFTLTVAARDEGAFALPIPAAPGDDSAIFEVSRIAAPMPTILPSYNQIGFDSIHYLVGLVEGTPGQAIAWGIGAIPAGPGGETIVDPASNVRFALEVRYDGGAITMINEEGFTIEFNGFPLPFESFRLSTRVDPMGVADASPTLTAQVVCGEIDFYGEFLQRLGFCNPTTDILLAWGASDLRPHLSGTQSAPSGLGTVAIAATSTTVTATYTGSSLVADEHNFGILLLDTATGRPVRVDYVNGTEQTAAAGGEVDTVTLTFEAGEITGEVRAYALVDAYPAAVETLTVP